MFDPYDHQVEALDFFVFFWQLMLIADPPSDDRQVVSPAISIPQELRVFWTFRMTHCNSILWTGQALLYVLWARARCCKVWCDFGKNELWILEVIHVCSRSVLTILRMYFIRRVSHLCDYIHGISSPNVAWRRPAICSSKTKCLSFADDKSSGAVWMQDCVSSGVCANWIAGVLQGRTISGRAVNWTWKVKDNQWQQSKEK